jgi:hypothetical protein
MFIIFVISENCVEIPIEYVIWMFKISNFIGEKQILTSGSPVMKLWFVNYIYVQT